MDGRSRISTPHFRSHATGRHGSGQRRQNAALPILAASILAEEPVCLQRVPRVADVATLVRLLGELGMDVRRDRESLVVAPIDDRPVVARYALVRRMRASFCVLGPLLAHRGRAVVSLPGGCNLGPRPVDLHLKGLAALGADLRVQRGYVVARAKGGRLRGATVDLLGPHGPTVTGTANLLCAAVLAEGETILRHAATEPEIVDLGNFLRAFGARIAGLGTSHVRIEGVRRLAGAHYRIIPDRIEAATLLLAAAISGGSVRVTGVEPRHLAAVIAALRAAGSTVEPANDAVALVAPRRPRPLSLDALPYPGLPSDVQAPWTALLALATGTSRIRDHVFPGRFLHAAELNRMGARTVVVPPGVHLAGVARLRGAAVAASDLRAAAALVLAGLAAEGETLVEHVHHLDRGYERLDLKLVRLGARIERTAGPRAAACEALALD